MEVRKGKPMKCAIMQPTYLPWSGYFHLIKTVDTFVFLDDAQYSKNSWHNRNRILMNGKEQWITVPIKQRYGQELNQVIVHNEVHWQKKHSNMIRATYGKHEFFSHLSDILEYIESCRSHSLSAINIGLITIISDKLGCRTRFTCSSALDIEGSRTARLINICRHCNCSEYLSPQGAKAYLNEDGDFEQTSITLKFQDYSPAPYLQKGKKDAFISHLSIIDMVANIGWENTARSITN